MNFEKLKRNLEKNGFKVSCFCLNWLTNFTISGNSSILNAIGQNAIAKLIFSSSMYFIAFNARSYIPFIPLIFSCVSAHAPSKLICI